MKIKFHGQNNRNSQKICKLGILRNVLIQISLNGESIIRCLLLHFTQRIIEYMEKIIRKGIVNDPFHFLNIHE